MGWRVLYIQESDYLSTMLDNIKIKNSDEKELLFPLKDIHTLILDNYKLVVSVQLLNKCAEYNINLISCGVDHNPVAILIPHDGHHAMAQELKKQISWQEESKQLAHQKIVKQKIINQYLTLKKLELNDNKKSELLLQYSESVELADHTNREGLASKVYFRIMFGENFQRFGDDVLNAGLNYGYAIIRSQINKAIVAKGLNASLGIIHKGPLNAFNLSDDVIEVFRPIIDFWVYENLRYCVEFTKSHRVSLIKLSTGQINYQGQEQTLLNSMVGYINSIVNFFEVGSEIEFPDIESFHEL